MYNEQEFIERIKSKAGELNILKEVEKELDIFNRCGSIEYLYLLEIFMNRIQKESVRGTMLRLGSADSYVGYILGFHKINPKEYPLFNSLFINRDYYDNELGPRFDISVPKSKKDEVIRILNEISPIDNDKSEGSIYYFGNNSKFRVGIFASELLETLTKSVDLLKENYIGNWCTAPFSNLNDKKILDYMFHFDDKGYYLPNLNGCLISSPSNIYLYMEASELHSLYDLAAINSISYCVFKDKELIIRILKQYGVELTIASKEQVLDILCNQYDMEEETVLRILDDILAKHHLSESDELILKSYEVPDFIISQLENANYLHYLSSSMEEVKIAYHLASIKMCLEEEFSELIPIYHYDSFVGPFFYIKGKLFAYKKSMREFNGNIRFFNALISHLEYFDTLYIRGDYGNYPRGRVLFDNYRKKFIVYLDKDLLNNKVKQQILETYNLDKYKVIFKTDSHYTHDNL